MVHLPASLTLEFGSHRTRSGPGSTPRARSCRTHKNFSPPHLLEGAGLVILKCVLLYPFRLPARYEQSKSGLSPARRRSAISIVISGRLNKHIWPSIVI